ncbi:MAG TPA: MBL fold metallo-hydrolase [Gemmatimonadales bacterium]|nr:MBL fold metallo-hydrolase [Gemmatimonadales bacterium]
MMRLYVLGSGSRGNCCAVEADGTALLLDAGFSAREIERRAEAAGLELGRVAGIALTHEHGDHACGAARLARRLGVPVLTATGTWARLAAAMGGAAHVPIGLRAAAELGPFRVEACPTSHDAADPVAIVVRTADGTGVGVAYDLGRPTAAVRYLLRNLTALVLEANHDEVRLRTSGYPPVVQRRIAGSGGHLSNRAAAELLMELHHPGLAVVVLAHLSRRCNTAADARATVAPALRRVGFGGSLHVAAQDEPLAVIEVAEVGRAQLRLAL